MRKVADKKNSFIMYTDYMEQISMLKREQRGDLFTAIMAYADNAELPDMDDVTRMAFCFIRSQMDRDKSKYLDTVEKRREAGKQGGRPKASGSDDKAKKANGFFENQTEAKKPDNVNDNDNVNVLKKKGTIVPKENPRFEPPSVENVMEYCREKGYKNVDADRFVDFYASKGWFVGKSKMKDWKAAVRNWERQESEGKNKPVPRTGEKPKNQFQQFPQREIDYDALVMQGLQDMGEDRHGT